MEKYQSHSIIESLSQVKEYNWKEEGIVPFEQIVLY